MAYTNAGAVKAYKGITGTTDDALLATLCTVAQSQIEHYTRRVFEVFVDTTRYCDAVADVDSQYLWLPDDLCQITSVTNGDGVVVAPASYVTQPRRTTPYYALKLLTSTNLYWTYTVGTGDPENAIAIVGRWAYSLTPPADVAHAATRLAAYLFAQKDASVYDITAQPDMGIITVPQGMPKDVIQLLAPYVRFT